MRQVLILLALLFCGCQYAQDEVYTFEVGEFEPDRLPGIEHLDRAAAEGDLEAQYKVVLYRHFMTGDYDVAIPIFVRLAAAGHAGAAGTLAYAYQHGKGVTPDYERAARWLERARDLGSERAARDLAAFRAHEASRES